MEVPYLELDPHAIQSAHDDLEMYIQILGAELNEDFDNNMETQRLTDKQKLLLPLFAQLITAHAHGSIESTVSSLEILLWPMLERMTKDRR